MDQHKKKEKEIPKKPTLKKPIRQYNIFQHLPSPVAIKERAWAGDSTTSSLIPST